MTMIETLGFVLIATLLGAIVCWLVLRPRLEQNRTTLEQLQQANQKIAGLSMQEDIWRNQREEWTERERSIQDKLTLQTAETARLEAEKRSLESTLQNQLKEREQLETKFTKEFENLANRIFDEKSAKFTSQNKISLDAVLTPLRDRILEFQKKVEETHTSSLTETSNLRLELKQLKDTSLRMTQEAENLTKALKNDSKTQGNWGEMILETILEGSGLMKGREYDVQKSFTTTEGKRFQPDVIVKLPESKYIIIDSKVSLTHYERQNAENDQQLRDQYLKEHVNSIRNHIRNLADKNYQDLGDGYQLDFILMFIPIEPAYILALGKDPTLFAEAYENHIILTSPSTLLASLRIIKSTWKHENQNKNAIEIANRGKLLLDKFINFTDDLKKVGEHLDRSEKAYHQAMGKLSEGRGSLVSQAQQLEDLGVKANKKLSDNFLISGE